LLRQHRPARTDQETALDDRVPANAIGAPESGQRNRSPLDEPPEVASGIVAAGMQYVVQTKSAQFIGFDFRIPALDGAIGSNHLAVTIKQTDELRH
jgi:hypothetical protein